MASTRGMKIAIPMPKSAQKSDIVRGRAVVVVLLVVDVAHLEHFVAGPIISTGKDRMELSCIIYTKWFSPSDGNISVDLEVVGDGGQVLQALIRTQHHGKMVVQT